jgi:hypothetical protein
MSHLLTLFLILISTGACNTQQTSGQDTSDGTPETKTIAEASIQPEQTSRKRAAPPGWPWRGVSVESKKTRPSDIAYLASVNVNFIRIMLKPDKRAKWNKADPTASFYAELAWADSLLNEAKSHNITALIAFNNLVLDPESGVDDKSAEFWENRRYRDSVQSMVEIIARRFKDRGNELAAYEIVGEPAVEKMGKSVHPVGAEEFFRKNLEVIRRYDQHRYYLLTPGPWGRPVNYKNFNGYDIEDNKIIYGAHMYMPDAYTHQGVKKRTRGLVYPGKINKTMWNKEMLKKQLSHVEAFQARTGAYIYIGEFQSVRWAQGANQWVKDVLDIMEEYNFSWSMYAFKCDTDFWDPYYDVTNRKAPPAQWEIGYVGPSTDEWKLFTEYFSRNKQ